MRTENRRRTAAGVAIGAWTAAGFLVLGRALEIVPIQFTALLIGFIGVAMWAGIILTRMNLSETVTAVFLAGIHAAEQRQIERENERADDQ